jgi:hypothetical protein
VVLGDCCWGEDYWVRLGSLVRVIMESFLRSNPLADGPIVNTFALSGYSEGTAGGGER